MRGRFVIASLAVVALGLGLFWSHGATTQPAAEEGISIYFSPSGGCTDAVVSAIGNAKESIFVQAYTFTSAPIAKALTDARARGVKITVILDKSQANQTYSAATFLFNHGVPVFIDGKTRSTIRSDAGAGLGSKENADVILASVGISRDSGSPP